MIFNRKAGFLGIPLVQATAIVLATSGGHDDYLYQSDVPGQPAYKGLFGIPDTADVNPKNLNLYDPWVNAKVAAKMWRGNGKTWGWLPQYAGGAWREYLESAREASLALASPQPVQVEPSGEAPNAAVQSAHSTIQYAVGQTLSVQSVASNLRP